MMNQKENIIYRFTTPIDTRTIPASGDESPRLVPRKDLLSLFPNIKNCIEKDFFSRLYENPNRTEKDISNCLTDESFKEKVVTMIPTVEMSSLSKEPETVLIIATNDFLNPKELDEVSDFISTLYYGAPTTFQKNGVNYTANYMVENEDMISVCVSEEQQTAYEYKIATPLHATFYPDQNTHEYASDDGITMDGDELSCRDEHFKEQLKELVSHRYNTQETLFGLAPYFDFDGAEKLVAVTPAIDTDQGEYYDALVLSTTVKTNEPLSDLEMEQFKDQYESQLSDGWGEWLEQQEIKTQDGDFYVHPWNADDSLFYMENELVKEPEFQEPEITIEPTM